MTLQSPAHALALARDHVVASPGLRAAWQDAVLLWGAHLAAVLGVALLSVRIGTAGAGLVHAHLLVPPVGLGALWHIWLRWGDASSYADIAAHGYASPKAAAYSPLLPLLERALSPVTAGDPAVAAVVIASLALLGAFALFRAIAEAETGDIRAARTSLTLLAFAPLAADFALGYTESLFLLLSLATFATLRRRHWLLAGICAALAAFTRTAGLLLALPLAVEAVPLVAYALPKSGRRAWRSVLQVGWRPALALALPLLGQAGLCLYFAGVYGDPLAAAHAERDTYGRWLDWPWFGPIQGIRLIIHHADAWSTQRAVFELGATLAALACALLLTLRRRPAFSPGLVWYGWAALLFTLMMPLHAANSSIPDAQFSLPRYLLADFPLYLALGATCARRAVARAALLTGSVLLSLMFALLQTGAMNIA